MQVRKLLGISVTATLLLVCAGCAQDSARDILNRMVVDRQLVVFTSRGDNTTPSRPNLYALKGTRKEMSR